MKKYFTIILIVFLSQAYFTNAQESIKFLNSAYSDNIRVNLSGELKNFLEVVKELNKKRDDFYGYRVKIFAENNPRARQNANRLRLGYNSVQDTVQAYVVFREPNFEVHIGDFRKRFEAVELLNKISEEYPEAYIVRTIVRFPDLESNEL